MKQGIASLGACGMPLRGASRDAIAGAAASTGLLPLQISGSAHLCKGTR